MTTKRAASAAPRKAADGTYRFVCDAGRGAETGRRQARRKGSRTKREAQQEMDRLRTSVAETTLVPPAQ